MSGNVELGPADGSPLYCRSTPAKKGDVQLAFGEREDGSIVHISDVPSGLACGCICPGCRDRLIARKGVEKAPHFAHHGDVPCRYALESALHKLAKQVLNERLELLIPEVRAALAGETLVSYEATPYRFDEAMLEYPVGAIVPDVIVRSGRHRLLVEIFVTHRCDDEKVARVRGLGLSCVEIDLRRLPRDATRAQVENALLASAPRHWIYNPKVDEALELLLRRIAAREEADRIAAERKAAAEARRLDQLAAKIDKAMKAQKPIGRPTSDAMADVREVGLAHLIDPDFEGSWWFSVDPQGWQAEILRHFVIAAMEQGQFRFSSFHATEVFKHLKALNMLRRDLPTYFDAVTEQGLKQRLAWFVAPYRIVAAYLDVLYGARVLQPYGKSWSVAHDAHRLWSDYRGRQKLREERSDRVRHSVERMLREVPETERTGFDFTRWFELPHPEFGISFAEAIASDESNGFVSLYGQLDRIEAMVLREGKPVQNLLGLPLHWERQRVTERKREEAERQRLARIEEEARAKRRRLSRLQIEADRLLHGSKTDWLCTPHAALEGWAPEPLAEASDAGLAMALECLSVDATARARQLEREALRSRLLRAAEHMRKPDHARLFLNVPNSRWQNRRPIDCCSDQHSFDTVKRAMEEAAS